MAGNIFVAADANPLKSEACRQSIHILSELTFASTSWKEDFAQFIWTFPVGHYARRMSTLADQLDALSAFNQVTVPDLWQQKAVSALREDKDVVVHAPTGAGKTLIFELWSNQGRPTGRAVYTVPTRALANDKLGEWRRRGWNVGIATGDLSDNLDAPIIVATLETQKNILIRGDGPNLLVVDEYQMIGDRDRGLNYELALALAPPHTRFLLLSGSVENPQHVVRWLKRLGRDATVVRHTERPVPLEEVFAGNLNVHVPNQIRGYWPRFCAKALSEDLGPILLFAPRRKETETLAMELARYLPNPDPLILSNEQRNMVGDRVARLLKSRISYHHSGMSYAARAGVIEPLTKAGQLRVVVATMGLAAGINFSLRSVALAGDSYRRDGIEQPIRGDEILQMFGRAGRRGIDEYGYCLISANEIRLRDGRPCFLARASAVDWGALLCIMQYAAEDGLNPFHEAVRVQERLFTTKPILLGVEHAMKSPDAPCGLPTDAERARHLRKRVREMLNSKGEWQIAPRTKELPLNRISVLEPQPKDGDATPPPQLRSVLCEPKALDKLGHGTLVTLEESDEGNIYGRQTTVAERSKDRVILAKWLRKKIGWKARNAPIHRWKTKIVPLIEKKFEAAGTPVIKFLTKPDSIAVQTSMGKLMSKAYVDDHGVALHRPPTRDTLPANCVTCHVIETCRKLPTRTGTALLWRRLGLVDDNAHPTRRGRIVSFYHGGDGIGVAAALEDESVPMDELVYELANLHAGFRFAGDDDRWQGRIAQACRERFGFQSISGYLQNGLPVEYGAGAEQIVESIHEDPNNKKHWVTKFLGEGDIDRAIIEWRSLLRQTAHSPDLDWPRWMDLKTRAAKILEETESPTLTDLPDLSYEQTRKIEHRLRLRRH